METVKATYEGRILREGKVFEPPVLFIGLDVDRLMPVYSVR